MVNEEIPNEGKVTTNTNATDQVDKLKSVQNDNVFYMYNDFVDYQLSTNDTMRYQHKSLYHGMRSRILEVER